MNCPGRIEGVANLIRIASNQDTEGIVNVLRTVYDEYGFSWDGEEYMADIYDVESRYLKLGNFFWVSQDDSGGINGTVGLDLFPTVHGKAGQTELIDGRIRVCACDCSLERLYVHPRARRQGIGTNLSLHCIDEAKKRGRKNMELWSDKKLLSAHRLYQSLGAVVVGERICHDPDNSPEWGMLLPLMGQ